MSDAVVIPVNVLVTLGVMVDAVIGAANVSLGCKDVDALVSKKSEKAKKKY